MGPGSCLLRNRWSGFGPGERFRVDVADPCSGIRSLFALVMIAALYAHFMLKTWWQKAILFVASIPLAMLGNLARILMLTFGIMTLGPEIAIGSDPLKDPSLFHMLAGYLVFTIALGGMILLALLLAALRNGNSWARKPASEPAKRAPPRHRRNRVERASFESAWRPLLKLRKCAHALESSPWFFSPDMKRSDTDDGQLFTRKSCSPLRGS